MKLRQFPVTLGRGSLQPLIPSDWVNISNLRNALASHHQTRTDVLQLASNPTTPIDVLCWSVFAWGGMRRSNRDYLKNMTPPATWLELADQIRAGELSRVQAYDRFAALAKGKKLSGVGPAFYTKLIYFLMPPRSARPIGYIMDQWAGCGVNLIANREVVLTDVSAGWKAQAKGGWGKTSVSCWVSNKNTGQNYEDYCQQVEAIAKEIDRTPDDTEFLLMNAASCKETWRDYVLKERKLPK